MLRRGPGVARSGRRAAPRRAGSAAGSRRGRRRSGRACRAGRARAAAPGWLVGADRARRRRRGRRGAKRWSRSSGVSRSARASAADRLLRGPRAAPLLEPRVEVGRHVRERGDLLAAQARRRGGAPRREADVVGLQRLAAAAQEVGEAVAVHVPSMRSARRRYPGTACPWIRRALVNRAGADHPVTHDHATTLPGGTFALAGDLTVTRMGYGAMQLAGPRVFGPPADRDEAHRRPARGGGARHHPHRHLRLLRPARHQRDHPRGAAPLPRGPAHRHQGRRLPRRRGRLARRPARPSELRQAVHDNLEHLGLDALDVVNLRMGGFAGPRAGLDRRAVRRAGRAAASRG